MTQERLQEARQMHLRGDLARAISTYDEILAADPANPDVWHLKGMAEHQSGHLEAAQASAARAIAAGGERPGYLLLQGGVLHDRGDLAGAEGRFARVVGSRPDWVPGHFELGRVHLDMGRPDLALKDFQAATALDGKHVRSWNGVGMALQSLQRVDEAMRTFNFVLTLAPQDPMAHFNLARLYNLKGDSKRALEHAQVSARFNPGHVDTWLLIGDLHRRNREYEPARVAYGTAVQAAPTHARAQNAYAELLAETGRYDEAKQAYRNVWAADPGSFKAALGANLLLPQVYTSVEHLEEVRRAYAGGLERLHEAADGFRYANEERALADARWTNFYLAYQGRNDRELQKRYGELLRRVLQPAVPQLFAPRPRRSGGARIRVGFLSHFFFNCTAGRYFSSWITHLDRSRFESFVYYTHDWVADDTKAMAAAADTFRHLPGRPLFTLARQVAADDLDILVYPELGMHPDNFALGSLRLAPVQCSGWGHPTTTGLPSIDWFISCESMEPADAAGHYNERLALLPGLGTRYAIPQISGQGTRADFGIPEDRIAYLVPQSLFKIHPDNDELIAQVLARDPRGVAVMFGSNYDLVTQAFGTRLARALRRHGLDLNQRVVFLAPNLPHAVYLRLNQLCDVMLDTLHWSGGNTSLDALACGLPVVTLPGSLMRGRQSQAMLRALGVEELVAADAASYVDKAVGLGADAEWRRALSQRILDRRGDLFEREEPVRALEDFLERAVRAG